MLKPKKKRIYVCVGLIVLLRRSGANRFVSNGYGGTTCQLTEDELIASRMTVLTDDGATTLRGKLLLLDGRG